MRKVLVVLGFVLGLYLVGRAVAELVIVDWSHPETVRNDWGGPSLAGVLAVHCGPGLVAAAWMIWWIRRRLVRRGTATP